MTLFPGVVLKKLLLENFKCFKGRQEIDLAPLTLVYGPNSSGKSSLLQALQLIANTVKAAPFPKQEPLRLLTTIPVRNLGDFTNVLHGQESDQHLSIGYKLDNDLVFKTFDRSPGVFPLLEALLYEKETTFGFQSRDENNGRTGAIHSLSIKYGPKASQAITYRLTGNADFLMPDLAGLRAYSEWLEDLQALSRQWIETYYSDYVTDSHDRLGDDVPAPSSLLEDIDPRQLPIDASSYGLLAWIVASTGKDPKFLGIDVSPWDPPVKDYASNLDKQIAQAERPLRRYLRKLYETHKELQLEPHELAAIVFSAGIPCHIISRYSDYYSHDPWERDDQHIYIDPSSIDVNSELLEQTFSGKRLAKVLTSFENYGNHYSFSSGPLKDIDDRQLRLQGVASSAGPFPLNLFTNYVYVEPLRETPKRLYTYNPETSHAQNDEFFQTLYQNRHDLGRLNDWLRRLDIDYEVSIRDVSSPVLGSYGAIILRDLRNDCELTLCDVGFGISQLLPILVDVLYVRAAVHLVEQPELHLHPRLQAELGSLFARVGDDSGISRGPNNSRSRGPQWIVETHSELILLRLRSLIKNGKISVDDVKVLYVGSTRNGSYVKEMRIENDGSMIDDWPAGFFEDKLIEMEGLL